MKLLTKLNPQGVQIWSWILANFCRSRTRVLFEKWIKIIKRCKVKNLNLEADNNYFIPFKIYRFKLKKILPFVLEELNLKSFKINFKHIVEILENCPGLKCLRIQETMFVESKKYPRIKRIRWGFLFTEKLTNKFISFFASFILIKE